MAVSFAVFPSLDAHKSDVSVISRHATAMEVCELVYGNAGLTPWDTIERFYESSAGTHVPFPASAQFPRLTPWPRRTWHGACDSSVSSIHTYEHRLAATIVQY